MGKEFLSMESNRMNILEYDYVKSTALTRRFAPNATAKPIGIAALAVVSSLSFY